MTDETVCVDKDILGWALASIGDESGGCPFEPIHADDPDHHGKEFADALFDALVREVAELDALRGKARL